MLHSKPGVGGEGEGEGGGGRSGGSVLLPRIARSGGVELPDIKSPPRTNTTSKSSGGGRGRGGGGGTGDGEGGGGGPTPTGLTRKNLTVSAATHSALMNEKRQLEAGSFVCSHTRHTCSLDSRLNLR